MSDDRDSLTVLVVAADDVACDRLGDAVQASIPCRVVCEHQDGATGGPGAGDADLAVIDGNWLRGSDLAADDLQRLAGELPVVVLALPQAPSNHMNTDSRSQVRDAVETALTVGGTRLYVLGEPGAHTSATENGNGGRYANGGGAHVNGFRNGTGGGNGGRDSAAGHRSAGSGAAGTGRVRLPVGPLETLSDREMEVLSRMAAGYMNRDIAGQLGLALPTVKFHVSNILRKLGVRSRAQAVSMALSSRMIRPTDVISKMTPSA